MRSARFARLVFVIGLAGSVAGCSGCGDSNQATPADAGPAAGGLTPEQAARVVAKVGDRVITLGDYAAVLDRMDAFDRLRYQTSERRRELLEELIDVELMAFEAQRRGLDKKPTTQEAVRQILRDALLAEARLGLPSPTDIPVEEVRAYYEKNRENYREPERRRVSAIVFDDEAKAKKVLASALEKKDATNWGKLFFEHSLTAAKEKVGNVPLDLAGDLGIVGPPDDPKGQNARVPASVQKSVFALAAIGDVHPELVADGGKFYVVRLNGRTAAHERSFEEAERSIRVMLLQQKQRELEEKLEQELRQKHKVEIDDEALSKVRVPSSVQAGGLPPLPAPPGVAPSAAPSVGAP
jgi:peptidyl-prolyl cis-trans isomerase C